MDKSEGTHVAVGATMLGTGGLVLAILIPLAAAAKHHPWTAAWFLIPAIGAGILVALGIYMLIAVYTGWRLPSTAASKIGRPNMKISALTLHQLIGNVAIVHVGFINEGGGDVGRASLTFLVPDGVTDVVRCDANGIPVSSPTGRRI